MPYFFPLCVILWEGAQSLLFLCEEPMAWLTFCNPHIHSGWLDPMWGSIDGCEALGLEWVVWSWLVAPFRMGMLPCLYSCTERCPEQVSGVKAGFLTWGSGSHLSRNGIYSVPSILHSSVLHNGNYEPKSTSPKSRPSLLTAQKYTKHWKGHYKNYFSLPWRDHIFSNLLITYESIRY